MEAGKKFRLYQFELYHFIVILALIVLSQIIIPFINNRSVEQLLKETAEFYRWDVAERIADQTTSSIELLLQRLNDTQKPDASLKQATIESLNMIFFLQKLQRNVADFSIILGRGYNVAFYDDGYHLYNAVIGNMNNEGNTELEKELAGWYGAVSQNLFNDEQIQFKQINNSEFLFLVPFSFRGEVIGALYMRINPDLGLIESTALNSIRQAGLIFSGFIIIGLLGIFLMTTFLLKERDQAKELLYKKREKQLTREIESRKDAMFVRRIYHAHHKAEKIIGFAKEDLLLLPNNIFPEIKERLNKYINFVGRVIYGMKNSNPPIQVIRNTMFRTNINELFRFIIDNIFKRVYREGNQYNLILIPDENCPAVQVNEYFVWEIFEPIINNSIDHNSTGNLDIIIRTRFLKAENRINIQISDNGRGIDPKYLIRDKLGVQKIFKESTSTKLNAEHSGFGCYIAYENCKKCGWSLTAENGAEGAVFNIDIPVN